MRVLCLAAALATACAFTTQPAAFTTQSPLVGERVSDNVVAAGGAHRTRRATIVMDGKANGEFHAHIVRTRTRKIFPETYVPREPERNQRVLWF